MKSVGQQLQEARQAKNWTPELAARETKIKVERVRDLEADDYSHFSSPTYARGFVRTYARALGLDEYRLLRQLDNKLPEDDNASFAQDNGLPYVPETSKPAMHVSSAPRTGLYIVLGLGCAVVFIISFVLVQAYRAGELQRYFADDKSDSITNAAPNAAALDSQTPVKAAAVNPDDTTHAAKAVPVDLTANANSAAPAPGGVAAPAIPPVITNAAGDPMAQPVDPAVLAAATATQNASAPAAPTTVAPVIPAAPATVTTSAAPPPSVAVSPAATPAPVASPNPSITGPITPAPSAAPAPNTDTVNLNPAATNSVTAVAPPADTNTAPTATNAVTAAVAPVAPPADEPPPAVVKQVIASTSARGSNAGQVTTIVTEPVAPVHAVRAQAVDPSLLAANQAAPQANNVPAPAQPEVTTAVDLGNGNSPPAFVDARASKRLVLTASADSYIRVTSLETKQVLYSSVLRTGQSMAFDGRKFSVSVNKPAAVDIMLDGVDYGPHSEGESPETFTLQSHQQ